MKRKRLSWRKGLVLALVFLLVASVMQAIQAATVTENWENAGQEFGLEFIPGVTATADFTIVASDGDPFTASNFPNADQVTVTAKFVDSYGNALDVNGDGVADTFSFTEDPNTPGRWLANITVGNVTPGLYTLRIEAIAMNTTTGEILDNATIEHEVFIAGGKYWVLKANVKDGDEIKVGSLNIKIASLSDLGAILDLGNLTTRSVTDDDKDGFFVTKLDINLDGVDDTWMVFSKSDDGTYMVSFYSNDDTFLDSFTHEEKIIILDTGEAGRENVKLKDRNTYTAWILWDKSSWSWIKATDYYIIPLQGYQHWKEGRGSARTMDVKIIKRTTWFPGLGGLWGSEEVVYEGPIFNRRVNIDNVGSIFGTWAHNMWNAQYRSMWEILQGFGDLRFDADRFELRSRNVRDLAISSEDWRGHNPLTDPLKAFFGSTLSKEEWEEILNFNITEISNSY